MHALFLRLLLYICNNASLLSQKTLLNFDKSNIFNKSPYNYLNNGNKIVNLLYLSTFYKIFKELINE